MQQNITKHQPKTLWSTTPISSWPKVKVTPAMRQAQYSTFLPSLLLCPGYACPAHSRPIYCLHGCEQQRSLASQHALSTCVRLGDCTFPQRCHNHQPHPRQTRACEAPCLLPCRDCIGRCTRPMHSCVPIMMQRNTQFHQRLFSAWYQ